LSARRLVVGLGNPGVRYRSTRHNCGFLVVEELARRWSLADWETVCNSRLARGRSVDLAMPQTFMNRSGYALRCLSDQVGYAPQDILVVYDDVSLLLGTLRLRGKGSPGGHRGLESIVEWMQTVQIPRLRLGILPETSEPSLSQAPTAVREEEGELGDSDRLRGTTVNGLADFVLAPFLNEELPIVDEMVRRAADACESWLEVGLEKTMNQFNVGSGASTPARL
jgi:PTH1 family peptidyl-tRNA hydrolase